MVLPHVRANRWGSLASSYTGTAFAKSPTAMPVPTCAACDQPATTTIPAAEDMHEHAAELWQALLRFVGYKAVAAPIQPHQDATDATALIGGRAAAV
jgi:hypothetical protein